MAHYIPDESLFSSLKDKVVVISGGATGIGAAAVRLLSKHGAHVFLGDVNIAAAEELVKQTPSSKFVQCDVAKYEDVYALFKTAYNQHGRIDHAISCAGIFEQGNWFDPELTIESVEKDHGNTKVIVNAFRESPGLFLYQTSKHAVHGLLRSSRKPLFERDGIRVNALCPGLTETPMTAAIAPKFKDAGLFTQSAESVANVILGVEVTESIQGKAFYIEGGDAWEFEDSFIEAQPQWLGEEPTRRMRVNTSAVQKGLLLPKE